MEYFKKDETLLERARRESNSKKPFRCTDNERMLLALAWARGEITLSAMQKVLGLKNTTTAYTHIAQGFREYIQQNENLRN